MAVFGSAWRTRRDGAVFYAASGTQACSGAEIWLCGTSGFGLDEDTFHELGLDELHGAAGAVIRFSLQVALFVQLPGIQESTQREYFRMALSFQMFVYDSLFADSGNKIKLEAVLCQLQ